MGKSFLRSFELVKQSFSILKKDKEIMLYPIISGVISLVLLLLFLVVVIVFYFISIQHKLLPETSAVVNVYFPFFVGLFLFYLLLYFVITFFTAGLMACVYKRLSGGDPTFEYGLNIARQHLSKIFIWAVISATIGVLLQILYYVSSKIGNKRITFLGRLSIDLLDIGWGLATFFIVPVLIFDNLSMINSIKKSGSLFKNTWGETVVGQFSIDYFFGMLGLIPFILFITILSVTPFLKGTQSVWIAMIALVIYLSILAVISSSLRGIFITALYIYANTGKIVVDYNPEIIKCAFLAKPN